VTRAVCAIAAAGTALTTAGLAGAAAPAMAATHPPGQTVSNIENAGYLASGRSPWSALPCWHMPR